ncbi:hypothetical protein NEHOM01_1475 [Nematocida homosporus]|uniref:uncharacterized protein n=1 Tax=Nematocida homosporus TaxID=1912981 RepID=UPI00221EACEB|nr:uncharacterized protein NEHOM01_1475 [Nematocida homosporus]KAI5186442.1 hypothetical protein NEHOM01_1475 [Nematocida homosporus]
MTEKEKMINKLSNTKSFLEGNTNSNSNSTTTPLNNNSTTLDNNLIPSESTTSTQSTNQSTTNPSESTTNSTQSEPLLKKIEQPEEDLLFSERCTLYKKEGSNWEEKSIGTVLGKQIEGKGVQVLFAMDNTRNILNVLISKKDCFKQNKGNIVFLGINEGEMGMYCLVIKNEQKSAEIVAAVHTHCA